MFHKPAEKSILELCIRAKAVAAMGLRQAQPLPLNVFLEVIKLVEAVKDASWAC